MKRYYPAILIILSALLVNGCAYRQITVPEVIDSDFASAYRNDLKTLSSDKFQGRKPGTPGGKLTQEYLINSFKSMGLEPGNNGSYLQEVKLSLSKGIASGIVAFNADGDTLNTEWNQQILPSIEGLNSDLSFVNKELVFVGFGSESEKFSWHDYEDIDVNGKIAIILRNHAGFAADDSSIMNDSDAGTHALFSTKYEKAESHGASGALIIVDTKLNTSTLTWEQRVKGFSNGQNSLYSAEKDTSTMELRALISVEIGKQLLASAGLDYDSLVIAAYSPGFKAFNLGVTLSGEFSHEETIYSSNNVLALIRGSKRPDEVVIYTAHWDHLGMNEELEGDSIFNGAADNGTGTASILNLARAFKAQLQTPALPSGPTARADPGNRTYRQRQEYDSLCGPGGNQFAAAQRLHGRGSDRVQPARSQPIPSKRKNRADVRNDSALTLASGSRRSHGRRDS